MTDIVERLRSRDRSLHVGAMCHEAADEIERLRKQAVADVVLVNSFLAQRDQAEAEVERLRERITWLQEQLEEFQKANDMSDIVERLRDPMARMSTAVGGGAVALCIEAADEIERLRRERMAMDEAMRQERHHGSIRNERHHRGADADSQRAPGDH